MVAASVHVGKLPNFRLPSSVELSELPLFDKAMPEDMGVVHFIGSDEMGNEVYCLGRRNNGASVIDALTAVCRLCGDTEPLCINTIPKVNTLMRIGGYLSREAGLTGTGRRLVILGTQKAFWDLTDTVRQTKKRLAEGPAGTSPGLSSIDVCKFSAHPVLVESLPDGCGNITVYAAQRYSILPSLAAGIQLGWFKEHHSSFSGRTSSRSSSLPLLEEEALKKVMDWWLGLASNARGLKPIGDGVFAYYSDKGADVTARAIRSWCELSTSRAVNLVDLSPLDKGTMRLIREGLRIGLASLPLTQVFLLMAAKGTIRRRYRAISEYVQNSQSSEDRGQFEQ